MANPVKAAFLDDLTRRFGVPRKMENSASLYEIAGGKARIYIRYSKKHPNSRTFFGLRKIDLEALERISSGRRSTTMSRAAAL